jgi:RimJ/RimL family protein N-acetyltransferase
MLAISTALVTERLLLRPFTTADLDDLFAIYARPEVVRYLYANVRSRDEVSEVLRCKVAQTHLTQEGDGLTLAIVLPNAEGTSEGVIGEIVLWWRSVEHRQGEIGFVLHPAYHGLAFREAEMHRIDGRTHAGNTASAALMQRLGMRQEAHFIQNAMFKGEWGDALVFALLESEWND